MSGPSNSSSLFKNIDFPLACFCIFLPLGSPVAFHPESTGNPPAIPQSARGLLPMGPPSFPTFCTCLSLSWNPMGLRMVAILPVFLGLKALWDAFLFKEKRRSRRGTEMSLLSLILDQKDKIMYLSTFNVITTTYINDFFKFWYCGQKTPRGLQRTKLLDLVRNDKVAESGKRVLFLQFSNLLE